ncbi:hypothetical protein HD597_000549 [Nonomuraea thailandensis]|uniref:Uncharacterized protein n=1 Tax=Nonomuraea thailandensis TaxID=1188745 RepID=A0A9X2JYV5_9ACTN|nr:DUF6348 family protein [Nonomuraea thailandensis]MCP2353529.1 hypothetical protein [Nonomuraea thailandensis]
MKFALNAIAKRMASYGERWRVRDGMVWGPGDSAVVIRELDFDGGPAHLDLGIDLNAKNQEAPILWDCTSGVGGTKEASIKQAVEMWAMTAGAAFMELLYQRGELAEHFQHDDPGGLQGHHVIHGPVGVVAMNGDVEPLTEWFAESQILPRLGGALAGSFDHPHLNGVKILCGGDRDVKLAEVRVNGEVHEQASAILREFDWPRGAKFAYARTYLLVLPDHG